MMCHYTDLHSASDWLKQFPLWYSQSEALPRFGQQNIMSMEFLWLFPRCHFVRRPVVASQNVAVSKANEDVIIYYYTRQTRLLYPAS